MPSRIEQVEQARAHIREAEKRVAEQVTLIERLRRDGHGTGLAERILSAYLDLLTQLSLQLDLLEKPGAPAREPGGR